MKKYLDIYKYHIPLSIVYKNFAHCAHISQRDISGVVFHLEFARQIIKLRNASRRYKRGM